MAEPHDREHELSELRIRAIAYERRAATRTGSYFLIAACGCLVGAAQFVYLSIRDSRPMRMIVAALLLILAITLGLRARSIRQRARQSSIPQPPAEPDFSTLSDGSQQWKNLEEIQD